MKYYRVCRLVYRKEPVANYPGQWIGVMSELLSEVLSEPKTWSEAYEEYRRQIWITKRNRIRVPKDMVMEIVLHGYCNKRKTGLHANACMNDRIVKEREWTVIR